MSADRLLVAYIGLLIVAAAIGALLGIATGHDAQADIMEQHP